MGLLHNGMLLSHKKEENFTFAAVWMDLENTLLNEISQSEKGKWPYDLIHMWNLMNKLN